MPMRIDLRWRVDRWCLWPGCDLRSGRCQTDHTTAWATNGPTRPDNGAPLCARHNRWKQHGYHTQRDPTGHWHTHRPDRTEIGCLDTSDGDVASADINQLVECLTIP